MLLIKKYFITELFLVLYMLYIYLALSPTTKVPKQLTHHPSPAPTIEPTKYPTMQLTINPTEIPTQTPTLLPSNIPTNTPTNVPTIKPTANPTYIPTIVPSNNPTIYPTQSPSNIATNVPTNIPTYIPTILSSNNPTIIPTQLSTNIPTHTPTNIPSTIPTYIPTYSTDIPTILPTYNPTIIPTHSPSKVITMMHNNLLIINAIFIIMAVIIICLIIMCCCIFYYKIKTRMSILTSLNAIHKIHDKINNIDNNMDINEGIIVYDDDNSMTLETQPGTYINDRSPNFMSINPIYLKFVKGRKTTDDSDTLVDGEITKQQKIIKDDHFCVGSVNCDGIEFVMRTTNGGITPQSPNSQSGVNYDIDFVDVVSTPL